MVTIRIGEAQRDFTNLEESWVNKEVNGRKNDGQKVCEQVIINEGSLSLHLISKDYTQGRGGSGSLSNDQERIWNLWKQNNLHGDFSGGNLIAFLKQLKKYL